MRRDDAIMAFPVAAAADVFIGGGGLGEFLRTRKFPQIGLSSQSVSAKLAAQTAVGLIKD
jgi:hypothetical protein